MYATDLFRYPLKISENIWFSDVFRGYWKIPVAWNELKYFVPVMSDSSMKTSTLKNNSENMVTLFKNASLSNLSRIFLKSGFKKLLVHKIP